MIKNEKVTLSLWILMKKTILTLLLCLFAIMLFPSPGAVSGDRYHHEQTILIRYKDEAREGETRRLHLQSTQTQKLMPGIEAIRVDSSTQIDILISELLKDESILFVETDKKLSLHANTPNDPKYPYQWGLHNIMAKEAWGKIDNTQKQAVVAVIDSGIAQTHPDLVNRITPGGFNFLSNSQNISDHHGHGTAIAGIIAAQTNNAIGIAGVAGEVDLKILPLKVSSRTGSSYLSHVIKAIDYAIEKRVDVINLSMGSKQYSDIENDAIQRAIQNGIVVVASAGNYGNDQYIYPASYDNVISVSSIGPGETISNFSSHNSRVIVAAPGEDIYSTAPHNSYKHQNGTSFATAFVSGMAAVFKAIDPALSPQEVKNIISTSSIDLGEPGRDDYYGYGLVNMKKAVKEITRLPTDYPAKPPPFSGSELSHRTDIEPEKIWTIVFNKEVDVSTVNEDSVRIFTENGMPVTVQLDYKPCYHKVIVNPLIPYEAGSSYYLYIEDSILAKTGQSLQQAVRMKFTVQ